MENDVYITKKLIIEKEIEEVDFMLHDEFGFKFIYVNNEINQFVELGDDTRKNIPVNIDVFLNELKKIKKSGSTHVSIYYHTDHLSYELDGYKIERSTQEDIEKYQIEVDEFNKLKNEYTKKYSELREIELKMNAIKP